MASLPSWLRTIGIVGSTALCVQGAVAADYLKFPVEPAPDYIGKPVELGSGWYLRGDVGWSKDHGPQLMAIIPDVQKNRWALDVGAGYKFNNWLRTDATITFNKPRDVVGTGFTVVCPYMLTGAETVATGALLGYIWDDAHDTCSSQNKAELRKTDLLLNAYVDLGSWGGLSPFVGVGAGVSMLKSSASLTYIKTSDGSIYGPDLSPIGQYPHVWIYGAGPNARQAVNTWTDAAGVVHTGQPPVAFDKQNWNRQAAKTTFNLAWSLTGGFAYDLTPQLKTEISYRYLNSGSFTSIASPVSGSVKTNIDSHQVRVGFRYMID